MVRVHFLGLQQRGCGFVSQVELLRGKTKRARGLLFTPGISCKRRRAFFHLK